MSMRVALAVLLPLVAGFSSYPICKHYGGLRDYNGDGLECEDDKRELFRRRYDLNGDGNCTEDEYVQARLDQWDLNGDGIITATEFVEEHIAHMKDDHGQIGCVYTIAYLREKFEDEFKKIQPPPTHQHSIDADDLRALYHAKFEKYLIGGVLTEDAYVERWWKKSQDRDTDLDGCLSRDEESLHKVKKHADSITAGEEGYHLVLA